MNYKDTGKDRKATSSGSPSRRESEQKDNKQLSALEILLLKYSFKKFCKAAMLEMSKVCLFQDFDVEKEKIEIELEKMKLKLEKMKENGKDKGELYVGLSWEVEFREKDFKELVSRRNQYLEIKKYLTIQFTQRKKEKVLPLFSFLSQDYDLSLADFLVKFFENTFIDFEQIDYCCENYLETNYSFDCQCTERNCHKRFTVCEQCMVDDTYNYCATCGVPIRVGSHCCECHHVPERCVLCGAVHGGSCFRLSDKINNWIYQLPENEVLEATRILSCDRKSLRYGKEAALLQAHYYCNQLLQTDDEEFTLHAYEVMKMFRTVYWDGAAVSLQSVDAIRDKLQGMLTWLGSMMTDGKDSVLELLEVLVADSISTLVNGCASGVSQVFDGFQKRFFEIDLVDLSRGCFYIMKIAIRAAIGFPLHHIAIECLWDDWVLSKGCEFRHALKELAPSSKEVASEQGMTVNGGIFAAISYAACKVFGLEPKQVSDFARFSTAMSNALPTDLGSYFGMMPIIGKFFDKGHDQIMFDRWPETARFKEMNLQLKEVVSGPDPLEGPMLLTVIRGLLEQEQKFIRERKLWNTSDYQFWSKFRIDLSIQDDYRRSGQQASFQQPAFWFEGDFGVGKSTICELLSTCIRAYGITKGWWPKGTTDKDFAYTVPNDPKHWDGFVGQLCVIFNDFMSIKDVPGQTGEAAVLRQVIDAVGYMPSMADLTHKSIVCRAWLTLVSSNLSFERALQEIKTMNNPGSLVRRFTGIFRIEPKNYNEHTGCVEYMQDVGLNQWWFVTTENGKEHKYDFDQVLAIMISSIEEAIKPKPFSHIPEDLIQNIGNVNLEPIPVANGEFKHRPSSAKVKTGINFAAARSAAKFRVESGLGPSVDGFDNFAVYVPNENFEPKEKEQEKANLQGYEPGFFERTGLLQLGERAYVALNTTDSMLNEELETFDEEPDEDQMCTDFFDYAATTAVCADHVDRMNELSSPVFTNVEKSACDFVTCVTSMFYPTVHVNQFTKKKFIIPSEVINSHSRIIDTIGYLSSAGYYVIGSSNGRVFDHTIDYRKEWPILPVDHLEQKYKKIGAIAGLLGLVASLIYAGSAYFPWSSTNENQTKIKTQNGMFDVTSQGVLFSSNVALQMSKEAYESISCVPDPIFAEQVCPLRMSHVLVGTGEKIIGYGFMVKAQRLLMPRHMAGLIKNKLVLYDLEEKHLLTLINDEVVKYVITTDPSKDLALVALLHAAVRGKTRNNYNKICDEFDKGYVTRLAGEDDDVVAYASSETPVTHSDFDSSVRLLHEVAMNSQYGFCGRMYFNKAKNSNARLVGMHVSGKVNISYFSKITKKWFDKMEKSLEIAHSMCFPPMNPVEKEGVVMETESVLGVSLPTTNSKKFIPWIASRFANKGFKTDVGLAKLNKWKDKMGNHRSPYGEASSKLITKQLENNKTYACAFSPAEEDYVAELWGDLSKYDIIESWEDCVSTNFDHDKVNPKTSGGLGFGNKGKYLDDEGKLLAGVKEALEEAEQQLSEGHAFFKVDGTTLKDEVRPMHKIVEGKTRIFVPVSFTMAMLVRRWYAGVYRSMEKEGVRLGIHYALSPEGQGQVSAKHAHKKVIGVDIAGQDNSHGLAMWIWWFKLHLKTGLFQNSGSDKRKVDPNLPPLNRTNRIRYGLLRQMMLSGLVLWKLIFMVIGALKTGGFETTGFNSESANAILHLISKRVLEELDIFIEIESFGDDGSLIADDFKGKEKEIIQIAIEVFRKFGYEITSQVKDQSICVQDYKDASLCGRKLVYQEEWEVWTKALEIERIRKIFMFAVVGDPAKYASAVANGIQELLRHGEKVYNENIECLVWENGVSVSMYIGDYMTVIGYYLEDQLGALERQVCGWVQAVNFTLKEADLHGDTANDSTPLQESAFSPSQEKVQTDKTLLTFRNESEPNKFEVHKHEQGRDAIAPFLYSSPVLEREVFLTSFTFGPLLGPNPNDEVWSAFFPSAYFDAVNKAQAELFDTTSIIYDYLELRFVAFGTGFQKGCLLVHGSPMSCVPSDYEQASTGPHALVNISSGEDVTFKVPYNRDMVYPCAENYNTAQESQLFDNVYCRAIVIVPVDSVSQPNVEVMVYAKLVGAKFLESGLTGHSVTPALAATHGERESLVPGQVPEGDTKTTDQGEQSTNVNNYPFSNWKFKVPIPLCKATAPLTSVLVRNAQGGWHPNCFGGDGGVVLGTGCESQGVPRPGLTGVEEIMTFEHLAAIPSLVAISTFADTDPPGTSLYNIPVSPCIAKNNMDSGVMVANCSYVASFFQYWKCDMVYRIYFVKPAAVAGAVRITVNYICDSVLSSVTTKQYGALYRTIIDLKKGDGSVTIRVPYIHPMPWKKSQFVYSDIGVGVLGPFLQITTVSKLTTNVNVSNNIQMLIYASAENFHGLWPTDASSPAVTNDTPSPLVPIPKLIKEDKGKEPMVYRRPRAEYHVDAGSFSQGGAMMDPSSLNFSQAPFIHLGPAKSRFGSWTKKEYFEHFGAGDYIDSFQQLFKRKILARRYDVATVGTGKNISVFDPNQRNHYPSSFLSFMNMFVFVYGGFRISIVNTDDPDISIFNATNNRDVAVNHWAAGVRPLDPIGMVVGMNKAIPEMQMNNVTRLPFVVYPHENEVPPFNRFDLVLRTNVQPSPESWVFFAVSDSFRAFGKNYNVDRAYATFPNQGAGFVWSVPAVLQS